MRATTDAQRPVDPDVTQAQACAAMVVEVLPAAMNVMRSAMRRRLAEGLSVPQFRCLNYIDLNPGASLGSVAAFLGVTLATASAMVDRLVQAGHLATGVSNTDRRRSELRCLPAGLLMLATLREATRTEFAELLALRPPADLDALLLGLSVLKRTLQPE